jgi:hypothetical protein
MNFSKISKNNNLSIKFILSSKYWEDIKTKGHHPRLYYRKRHAIAKRCVNLNTKHLYRKQSIGKIPLWKSTVRHCIVFKLHTMQEKNYMKNLCTINIHDLWQDNYFMDKIV